MGRKDRGKGSWKRVLKKKFWGRSGVEATKSVGEARRGEAKGEGYSVE